MGILKLKDKVTQGVKANKSMSKFVIIAFVVVFCIREFTLYKTLQKYRSENIVIYNNGELADYKIEDKKAHLKSTISVHCESVSAFINSMDRISIRSNQAKALFLVERKSLLPIFEYYTKTGVYNQVLKLGYTYKSTYKGLRKLDLSSYPYSVQFSSIIEIFNGYKKINEIEIISKGLVSTIKANKKQSPQGYYITDYTQNYQASKTFINEESK